MNEDSVFLRSLLGKPVRIVAVDEVGLPPLVLREVCNLGIVVDDDRVSHFYPWSEIVEIRAAEPALASGAGAGGEP